MTDKNIGRHVGGPEDRVVAAKISTPVTENVLFTSAIYGLTSSGFLSFKAGPVSANLYKNVVYVNSTGVPKSVSYQLVTDTEYNSTSTLTSALKVGFVDTLYLWNDKGLVNKIPDSVYRSFCSTYSKYMKTGYKVRAGQETGAIASYANPYVSIPYGGSFLFLGSSYNYGAYIGGYGVAYPIAPAILSGLSYIHYVYPSALYVGSNGKLVHEIAYRSVSCKTVASAANVAWYEHSTHSSNSGSASWSAPVPEIAIAFYKKEISKEEAKYALKGEITITPGYSVSGLLSGNTHLLGTLVFSIDGISFSIPVDIHYLLNSSGKDVSTITIAEYSPYPAVTSGAGGSSLYTYLSSLFSGVSDVSYIQTGAVATTAYSGSLKGFIGQKFQDITSAVHSVPEENKTVTVVTSFVFEVPSAIRVMRRAGNADAYAKAGVSAYNAFVQSKILTTGEAAYGTSLVTADDITYDTNGYSSIGEIVVGKGGASAAHYNAQTTSVSSGEMFNIVDGKVACSASTTYDPILFDDSMVFYLDSGPAISKEAGMHMFYGSAGNTFSQGSVSATYGYTSAFSQSSTFDGVFSIYATAKIHCISESTHVFDGASWAVSVIHPTIPVPYIEGSVSYALPILSVASIRTGLGWVTEPTESPGALVSYNSNVEASGFSGTNLVLRCGKGYTVLSASTDVRYSASINVPAGSYVYGYSVWEDTGCAYHVTGSTATLTYKVLLPNGDKVTLGTASSIEGVMEGTYSIYRQYGSATVPDALREVVGVTSEAIVALPSGRVVIANSGSVWLNGSVAFHPSRREVDWTLYPVVYGFYEAGYVLRNVLEVGWVSYTAIGARALHLHLRIKSSPDLFTYITNSGGYPGTNYSTNQFYRQMRFYVFVLLDDGSSFMGLSTHMMGYNTLQQTATASIQFDKDLSGKAATVQIFIVDRYKNAGTYSVGPVHEESITFPLHTLGAASTAGSSYSFGGTSSAAFTLNRDVAVVSERLLYADFFRENEDVRRLGRTYFTELSGGQEEYYPYVGICEADGVRGEWCFLIPSGLHTISPILKDLNTAYGKVTYTRLVQVLNNTKLQYADWIDEATLEQETDPSVRINSFTSCILCVDALLADIASLVPENKQNNVDDIEEYVVGAFMDRLWGHTTIVLNEVFSKEMYYDLLSSGSLTPAMAILPVSIPIPTDFTLVTVQ